MSTQTDEQHVRDVIDSAMSGSRPPHDLAAGALARGRRLRTRRRACYAAAGVASIVALAVALPWIAPSDDGPVRGDDLVATQPPSPDPTPADVPPGWWDVPATDMVSAVGAILPDGIVVTDPGPLEADSPEGGPARGWISPHLLAPSGDGSLNVIVSPGPTPGMGQIGTDREIGCGGARSSDRARCEELLDTEGNVIGRRLTERWIGSIVVNEVLLRRDRGTVYAATANTLDDKWSSDSPVSAQRPPLTLDQLEALVRNDTWVSYEP